MGDVVSAALACFGVEGRRAVKVKGHYVCQTAQGLLRLTKTTDPPETLHFVHTVKEALARNGFTQTDRCLTGPEGLPYAHLGAERFLLTRWAGGRETDFTSPEDATYVMAWLGRLHAAARGVPPNGGHALAPCQSENFRRGAGALDQAVKRIKRRGQLSDFDLLLVRNAPAYGQRIAAAAEGLEAAPYAEMRAHAVSEGRIRHNALKEEHITFAPEGCVHFNHFSLASVGVQLNDVAAVIRRYALRGGKLRDLVPLDAQQPPARRGGGCFAGVAYLSRDLCQNR
jgi:hypothetical protein